MAFKDTDAKVKGSIWFQLKGDGDNASLVFLEEPMPRESKFRGKSRTQAAFPILTKEGVQVWSVSGRTYQQIRANWAEWHKRPVTVTRHGKAKSIDTVYEIVPVDDKGLTKSASNVKPDVIDAVMTQALSADNDTDDKPKKTRKPKI